MPLRLLFATDLHGRRAAYEELFARARRESPDAVLLGGDLLPLPHGRAEGLLEPQRSFVRDFLEPALLSLRAGGGPPVYGIFGNDDWAAVRPSFAALEAAGAYHDLHMRRLPLGDHFLAGYSCVPVTPFRMSDFDRFDAPGWSPARPPRRVLLSDRGRVREGSLVELRQRPSIAADLRTLERAGPPGRTIYVCHTPPHGTRLDRMHGGRAIGSPSLRAFLERAQPPLSLHGHVHESPRVSGSIEDRIDRTLCVNPGDSRTRLRAVLVEVDDTARLLA